MTIELYNQVIAVTEEFLGPAAPRFIDRQIAAHLGKQPRELTRDDMPTLIEWSKVTLGLITQDREVVQNFQVKMAALAGPHR